MFSKMILSTVACLALVNSVRGQLVSVGLDIANGGTYYFNLASTAPFSFKGGFSGGTIVDTVTPTITLPSGSTVSCSSITTDQTDYESVCPLTHSQIVAGSYTILLIATQNGIEFGRGFTVVNTQTTFTVLSTPTVVLTSTPISIATTSSTTTMVDTITASAVTLTSPAATSGTLTILARTTSTTTKVNVHTKKSHSDTTTTSTSTITPHCTSTSAPKRPDETKLAATPKTSTSSRGTLSSSTGSPTSSRGTLSPSTGSTTSSRGTMSSSTGSPTPSTTKAPNHHRRSAALSAKLARRAQLAKRDGPDGPLTTTVIQTVTPAVVQTVLAAPSTITETNLVEVVQTTTLTPSPVTVFSGTVAATVTSTFTVTKTAHSSSTTTSTVVKTQTAIVKATLVPSSC